MNEPIKRDFSFPGHLTLVKTGVVEEGSLDPEDVDFAARFVEGGDPLVVGVGQIVQSQQLRNRLQMPQPRYLRRTTIISTCTKRRLISRHFWAY